WQIPRDQLKVIESKQVIIIAKTKNRAQPTEKLHTRRRVIDNYAIMGITKAEFVCLKQNKRIKWPKHHVKALAEMRSLNHENLAEFFGVCCNNGDHFYALYNLIERASLEDFIRDLDFDFDATFQAAFLNDILRGLQYLHKSRIGYHGLLNVQTCLIDANWVLRMSHFGLSSALNEFIKADALQVIDKIPQAVYVHVAPEHLAHLKISREYPKGSPEGDFYSFGIILYSMLYRCLPFERLHLTADGNLLTTMNQCFSRPPESRPSIRELQLIKIYRYGNLVDQMLRMNEKYAENLERIVAERTALLAEAQQQTDRLLCEMLPPSIAARLKAGEAIIPRNYKSVTVGFFQICNFEVLMKKCTPNQVRIKCYYFNDAYKVETTGENYMLASGVPNENQNRHVFVIADIAIRGQQSPTIADWKFVIRIGFHTGPIAAGVIGLRSPRYCLFGDTVNFASRMQSTCNPNQIQIAESTAKLLQDSPKYRLTKRGIVSVKGKGEVNTYWLDAYITSTSS
uniref:guanylate cyclase n=1 Tax=Syphacia muris TaxID=451379 RepID=A0A0N5AD78_9BILA